MSDITFVIGWLLGGTVFAAIAALIDHAHCSTAADDDIEALWRATRDDR